MSKYFLFYLHRYLQYHLTLASCIDFKSLFLMCIVLSFPHGNGHMNMNDKKPKLLPEYFVRKI